MVELVILAQQAQLDLTRVMQYRLTEVPLALFNMNSTLRKTVKAKLVNELVLEEVKQETLCDTQIAFLDMGLYWRLATPTQEDRDKEDGEPFTWADYAAKIFGIALSRHKHASTFHFINDRYDVPNSIKDMEHQRRSMNSAFSTEICNLYIKRDQAVPKAQAFDNFFANKGNKLRLQEFLWKEFKLLALDKPQEFFYTAREKCVNLKTSAVSPELECHHHEADTRLFFHASKVLSQCQNPIIIDSEDTDVVAIAAQAAHKLPGQMLLYQKGHLFDCHQMCSSELASVIVQLHAFTGADAISGFFDHGKVSVLKKAKKTPEFATLISDLGSQVELCSDVLQKLTKFTIKCIYRDVSSQSLAEARSSKWLSMKKKSTERLPPDEDSLVQHCRRANYQCYIWRHFHEAGTAPSPLSHGWKFSSAGLLEPVLSTLQAIPDDVIALRVNCSNEQDVGSIDWESESDSEVLSDSDSEQDDATYVFDV